MENLAESALHVVLGIKEGRGFGFLTSPIIVVANLNGNKLETDTLQPSSDLNFDTELIWESDKKYFRRLRIGNTPLRIECYAVQSQQKRDRIGYVLLNLKQAQVISREMKSNLSEHWHRLLGLRSDTKSHRPELLLTFKVDEAMSAAKEEMKNINLGVGDIFHKPLQDGSGDNKYFQIGNSEDCSQIFEIKITVLSTANLQMLNPVSPNGSPKPSTLQFSMFSSTFHTNPLSESVTGEENIVIIVRTKQEFLSGYFQNFPNLMFKLLQKDKIVGTASLDLKNLTQPGNQSMFPSTLGRNCATVKEKLFLDSPLETRKDKADDMKPCVEVEFSLTYKGSDINKTESMLRQAPPSKTLLASGDTRVEKEIDVLSSHKNENIYILNAPNPRSLQSPTPRSVVEEMLKVQSLDGFPDTNEVVEEPEPVKLTIDNQKYHSPQKRVVSPSHQFEPARHISDDNRNKDFARETAHRVCEELEDWKERQQELFKYELKRKTERHLHKLSSEWLKKQKEIEDDFNKRVEQCKALTESLTEASKELGARTELNMKKEKELSLAQEELDRQYTTKFQELREASRRHQVDMEHKISLIETEKEQLIAKLEASEKQKERLKQEKHIKQGHLTNDQTAALIIDMKCLEEKLEAALESKAFFKEQWGRAVREIHKLKAEQQEHLKMQITRNKMELEKMGLVETISRGERELKEDQSLIQNLRSQLLQCQAMKNNGNNVQAMKNNGNNVQAIQEVNHIRHSDFKSDSNSDSSANESPLSI